MEETGVGWALQGGGKMSPALNVGGTVCVNMATLIKLYSLNMFSSLHVITPQ